MSSSVPLSLIINQALPQITVNDAAGRLASGAVVGQVVKQLRPSASRWVLLQLPATAADNWMEFSPDQYGNVPVVILGEAGSSAISTDGTLSSESDNKIPTEKAVKEYADAAAAAASAKLVNSSPEALDTLKEFADALGADPHFATTVLNALAEKADVSAMNTALATKANAADVTNALAGKVNTGDMNTALATKADASTTTNALAEKADASAMTTALAGKADAASVTAALAAKAPTTSPALAGTPTAPTATQGTNSTQLATTAFVKTAVANALSGANNLYGGTVAYTP